MSSDRMSSASDRLSDLVDQRTEWGFTVAESKARKSALSRVLAFGSGAIYFLAAIIATPVVIGALLFPESQGLLREAGIVALCVAIALLFQKQSRKGPKNALQIDYAACEVRLGSENAQGVFVRHRVCPFAQIETVFIDRKSSGGPELCLKMKNEIARIRFHNVDDVSLTLLAAKISAAREGARKMPLRSRIQSTLFGIEASAREVGQRVRSRVVSRAV